MNIFKTAQEMIGVKFNRRINARLTRLNTVVDVRVTFNSKAEIVDVKFVSVEDFCGQKVYNYEVPLTTIKRNIIED